MNTDHFTTAETGPKQGLSRSLVLWMLLLVVIKLWLVQAQDVIATYTPADDYLFVKLAKHILTGSWLGPYDQFTLVKGPVYPLFIAAAHYTGLPLLVVQHLLYSLLCILAVMALRPLLRSQWLFLVIFFLLLYNPFTYAYPASGRLFRLGLSMPLVLAFFGCMGGLLLRTDSPLKVKLRWSAATGLFFSLLWYTREEGIWLLPSLVLFGVYFLFMDGSFNFKKQGSRLAILLPIPLFFICFTATFSQLNQKYYGAPCINLFKSAEFQSALGGLMNINVVKTRRYIPVNSYSQKAAYEVSPTFRQLQPFFEEKNNKKRRMPDSFYLWILLDVVRESGNDNTLPESLEFYRKVGSELKEACDTGAIPCLDRKPSIKPVWWPEYFKLVPRASWNIFTQAVTFNYFSLGQDEFEKWKTTASKEMVEDYRFVTRETLVPGHWRDIHNYPDYYRHMKTEKFRILADIGEGYKMVVPVFFTLAVLVHLFFIGLSIKRRHLNFATVFGLIILGGIISLVAILTYIKITLWPINRPLFSAYPLVLYYISVMIVCAHNFFKKDRYAETIYEPI